MWALENFTPFAAERVWVRDAEGVEIWVVAIKGSFRVDPDGCVSVAPDPVDICRAPLFYGDAETSSLRYDTDLVRCRKGTDVILNGHAHAPGGEATRRMDVRMRVGALSKTLRVFGDRRWHRALSGLKASEPQPFTTMPIRYERAFGGRLSASNPVGTGMGHRSANFDGMLLPNVENPTALITSWSDRPGPAGFGPIPGHWSPRKEFAGTFDERWMRERQPLLPHDFDDRYYQSAPADQQVPGGLLGGEPVELVGLTEEARLCFELPRVRLGVDAHFFSGRTVAQRVSIHSVIFEPETRSVVMVWHSALACHHDAHQLRASRIFLKRHLNHPSASSPVWGVGGEIS